MYAKKQSKYLAIIVEMHHMDVLYVVRLKQTSYEKLFKGQVFLHSNTQTASDLMN